MEFIREIPSDSVIKKIEIFPDSVNISLKFGIKINNRLEGVLIFKELVSINIAPGWNGDIEGISIENNSDLLEKIKATLRADEEPEDFIKSLKNFRVFSSTATEPVVIEIIAQSYILK
jgi:hypothetical protein